MGNRSTGEGAMSMSSLGSNNVRVAVPVGQRGDGAERGRRGDGVGDASGGSEVTSGMLTRMGNDKGVSSGETGGTWIS